MNKIESEENEATSKKSAANKFRKTKKYLSINNNSNANSVSKYQAKAHKTKSTLN